MFFSTLFAALFLHRFGDPNVFKIDSASAAKSLLLETCLSKKREARFNEESLPNMVSAPAEMDTE